jgi:hypothetical protein
MLYSPTREDTYFDENKEKLLALNESDLDFMLQELSAFASLAVASTVNKPENTIPVIPSSKSDLDPKELAKRMREQR